VGLLPNDIFPQNYQVMNFANLEAHNFFFSPLIGKISKEKNITLEKIFPKKLKLPSAFSIWKVWILGVSHDFGGTFKNQTLSQLCLL
jgi:hypothetical protein